MELVDYVKQMGYSHIEILPVMEHPFDGSWGYQITGYFAPTSRYGKPTQFKHFVDACHQAGIGVILDWVPGGFCRDEQGLVHFNGDKLYEKEEHPNWGTSCTRRRSTPTGARSSSTSLRTRSATS